MSSSSPKLDALTSTRFFAAFSVVLFHSSDVPLLALFPITPLFNSGFTAVNYFFVLSGFVMALAYYRPEQRFNFRSYWTARFSRIYPLYIFSFVLTCVYYLSLMGRVDSNKIWANVLLYQAWIPRYAASFNFASWSLAVEAFFYILFPLVVIFALRQSVKRLIWMSLGFWVLSQGIHHGLFLWLGPESLHFLAYFPLFHLNSFLLGVTGGVWFLTEAPNRPFRTSTNLALMIFSLTLVAGVLTFQKYSRPFANIFWVNTGMMAPIFLIFIMTLALDRTRVSKVLSHPWLVLLGDASYALYILHIPIRWILEKVVSNTGSTMSYSQFFGFLYLPVLFVGSILTFLFIERPARDWLRHNMHKVPLMVLDLGLMAGSIWAGFFILVGNDLSSVRHTHLYVLRVGLAVLFISLLLFRFYNQDSWKPLLLAILSGAAVWAGLVYLASLNGWIEAFPRVILVVSTVFIFCSILLSRLVVHKIISANLVSGMKKWLTTSDLN